MNTHIIKFILFILSVICFIFLIDYLSKFQLTFSFVITSIYFLVFIISGIYGFRVALYSNINKEVVQEKIYSIPKTVKQTAKSISKKIEKEDQEYQVETIGEVELHGKGESKVLL